MLPKKALLKKAKPDGRGAVCEPLEERRLLAVTYFVSSTGNDLADGRTLATAWKTIARVNKADLNAGDAVLFEGGKTFGAVGSTGSNVIANPGFESGLANWSDTLGASTANGSVTTSTFHAGTQAIKLSGSGAAIRAQDVTSKLRGNQTYMMSAWTRATNLGSGDRRVGLTFYSSGAQVATFYKGFRSSDWADSTWEFVSPPSFDRAMVWVSRRNDSSTFYVDDLSLKQIPNGLIFDAADSGTTANPVVIASYGKGKATINGGDSNGIWGSNVAGISIQNLNVRGSWDAMKASGINAGVGIEFVNTRSDNSKLEYVVVYKCDVRGFRWAGIRIGGWTNKSGFKYAMVTYTVAAGNGDVGITVRGEHDPRSNSYANTKVYIAFDKVYYNTGISDKFGNSGSGILLTDTNTGMVERCIAYENGTHNDYVSGGPCGIWAFDATRIVLSFNESYSNHTGSTRDGAGFDFDGGVTNSFIENNFSHDNDGAGFLLTQFAGTRPWGMNYCRYNISQNDGRKNAYGALTLTGPPGSNDLIVENNTLFVSPSAGASPSGIRGKYSAGNVQLRNNIVYTTGGVTVADFDTAANSTILNGNDYYSGGGLFKIRWGGTTYNSLADFRAATGKETNGSTPTGMSVNPMLVAPGSAPALGDTYKLPMLTQYKLLPGSPMLNAGVVMAAPFLGYGPSTYDFFVRATNDGRRDVGASEGV